MPDKYPHVSYLALGDSYTIGEGVLTEDSFPFQLASALLQNGINITDPEIVAQTGWTTGELLDGLKERELTGPYSFVTLLIGVNNQYRSLPIEAFQREFKKLADRAISFSGQKRQRVFVLSIPDWSVTPFAGNRDRNAISLEIDRFNEMLAVETENLTLKFVDITNISRLAQDDPGLISADGLHPSHKMYTLWADILLKEVVEAVNDNS